jgi:Leucine-rich repeat (LRR) protein
MDYNKLTAIPPEIGNLSSLTGLALSNNQLTSIPIEIGNLDNLQSLYLDSNGLTGIPKEIGNLPVLWAMSLRSNYLTSIPEEIGNCSMLNNLSLSNNELTSIPSELSVLTNLSELYLDHNHLTSLPPEMITLDPANIYVDIRYNHFCDIPDSIYYWLFNNILSETVNEILATQRLDDTTLCDGTGTKEPIIPSPKNELTIHHKPLTNSLTLNFPTSSDTKEVSIYALKGTLVKKLTTTQSSITLNTAGLESGVYYIKAVIDGKAVVRKVVL